jgi:hypothetical protein
MWQKVNNKEMNLTELLLLLWELGTTTEFPQSILFRQKHNINI